MWWMKIEKSRKGCVVQRVGDKKLKISTVWVRIPSQLPIGDIAQWLERPSHKRRVMGSSPIVTTIFNTMKNIQYYYVACETPDEQKVNPEFKHYFRLYKYDGVAPILVEQGPQWADW